MINEVRLAKSKILAFRQCPKKLWLEVNRNELAVASADSQKNFAVGYEVGVISRALYNPINEGVLIDPFKIGFNAAIERTNQLLEGNAPIFEAAFSNDLGFVLADVMVRSDLNSGWRMIEIKSSSHVKNYHLDDVAIQHYVATSSEFELDSIALGHIDNQWVYNGDGDYKGLITEVDLTEHARGMAGEVKVWFDAAYSIANQSTEPNIKIGSQCKIPFTCPFLEHCSKELPTAKHPVNWLPRIQKKILKQFIRDNNVIEMQNVPDELLNANQQRVKDCTIENVVYFDQEATHHALAQYAYPHYFLDFETINPAVPKWKGTRPYQQIPFQFSLHIAKDADSNLRHKEYLDLSGNDPSIDFTTSLIEVCGSSGPIFVYNLSFESARIKDLILRFPEYADQLHAINTRLVDLWPIAKAHYYHPSQQGSWSIKNILPALSNQYNYDQLEGVKDGGMAMDAFVKAINPQTAEPEKLEI